MSHGITAQDGMFSVREIPWHRLGTVLDAYPTREEAKAIAHPWEVVQEPVYRKQVYMHTHDADCGRDGFNRFRCGVDEGPYEVYEEVEGQLFNVRTDTQAVLGVAPITRGLVSNEEMYDVAEAIEKGGKGDVMYETGGSLYGGARTWLMLRLKEPLFINGDPNGGVVPYYVLQNDFTGKGAFRGSSTKVRVVCQNTAHAADLDAQQRGTEFVFPHTSKVSDRIQEAIEALAGWRTAVKNYEAQMNHLQSLKVTPENVSEFVDFFLPLPNHGAVTERVMLNAVRAQESYRDILNGQTCEGIGDTSYGLVQAAVEYVQWSRKAHNETSRFRRTFLDRNKVLTEVTEFATALGR